MVYFRLFSEDGNYDVEEAKGTIKNLNKVNANANKSFELVKKQNKSLYDHYVHKLEAASSEALSRCLHFVDIVCIFFILYLLGCAEK